MSTSKLIWTLRRMHGYSQTHLATLSKTSLPTIQNIEAGRANPSLKTLQKIAQVLHCEIKIDSKPPNWDLLAWHGVPILTYTQNFIQTPTSKTLVKVISEACMAVLTHKSEPDQERKLEALQAVLIALKTHFPKFFEKKLKSVPSITELYPKKLSGRLIRLKRYALQRLCDYL